MDILEHLGMKVPDIEGHGVIISRATSPSDLDYFFFAESVLTSYNFLAS